MIVFPLRVPSPFFFSEVGFFFRPLIFQAPWMRCSPPAGSPVLPVFRFLFPPSSFFPALGFFFFFSAGRRPKAVPFPTPPRNLSLLGTVQVLSPRRLFVLSLSSPSFFFFSARGPPRYLLDMRDFSSSRSVQSPCRSSNAKTIAQGPEGLVSRFMLFSPSCPPS